MKKRDDGEMKKSRIILIFLIIAGLAVFNFPFERHYVAPILMYHKIDKEESLKNKLAVSPETFERQMNFLSRNKYNVISLRQFVDLVKAKKMIPKNTVVVTFDDGYENNYREAFPILKKYNIPATIFIITDFIGKPGYMSRAQLKELSDSGVISIASHTVHHPVLTKIGLEQVKKEVKESKAMLEELVAKPVELFSYPLGAFDKDVRQEVIRAGYLGAVATNPGKNYPSNDVYVLKRMRIAENAANMFIFWVQISGYYTFIKEHRDD